MLGSPAGPGGGAQRGQWPLAPAPACANTFAADGFSKYGVYSLFPGGPSFGSALYTHASTIGRFASNHIQQPSGNPFHKDIFSPGYTFGALTPPPGSPYSPVPVSQLELFAKSFNSNIILQQPEYHPLSPNKAPQILEKRCDDKCCNLKLQTPCNCDFDSSAKNLDLSVKTCNFSDNAAKYSDYPDKYADCLLKFSDNNNKYVSGNSRGCSRTNPIEWNSVNVKKEPGTPCQVAEISTSASPSVKVEVSSPTQKCPDGQLGFATGALANTNGPHIPVGVAVARQRIQQNDIVVSPSLPPAGLLTTVNAHSAQVKEVARVTEIDSTSSPVGMAAAQTVGGPAGGTLLQCTDDRGAQLAGWPMGGAHGSALTAPTLWQYPASVPMEPMVPLPFPPVGLQLVREPTTGGFLLLPTATGIEPLQQAVVWPSYHQPSSLFLPPIPPPPLQLLSSASSDYLQTSTTLHQHTQTHSTRLLAVTTDSKRKIPLPIPATTLIKIEADASNIDHSKALQTVNTGAVFADQNMPPLVTTHVIYQHPTNLILSQQTETICKSQATSPVMCLTPPPEDLSLHEDEPQLSVQDASNQTDTPICSEDDNTTHTISDVIGEVKAKIIEQEELRVDTVAKEDGECQTSVPEICEKIVELQIPETTTTSIESEEAIIHIEEVLEQAVPETTKEVLIVPLRNDDIIQDDTVEQSDIVESTGIEDNTEEIAAPIAESTPDLSGLELLSNSIVEFENRKSVELENQDKFLRNHVVTEPIQIPVIEEVPQISDNINKSVEETSFVGLDLLCALAEQRILEEKCERPREKERDKERTRERRREKRKSRKHRDEPRHKKVKYINCDEYTEEKSAPVLEPVDPPLVQSTTNNVICTCQGENFRSYKNPKSAQEVKKFIASKSQTPCCDDDWPNMNAMELDMRMKLADLQRQYREKQKELSKLKPKKHSHDCSKKRSRKKSVASDRSTPPPVLEKITIPLKPHKTTDLIKPPTLKAFGEMSPKMKSSKVESIESPEVIPEERASKKRKVGRPKKLQSSPGLHVTTETIVAKKPKKGNFVGYFLAAKEKYQQNKFYTSGSTPPRYIEDTTHKPKKNKPKNNNTIFDEDIKMSKIRPKLKAELTLKTNYDSPNEEEDEEELEEEEEVAEHDGCELEVDNMEIEEINKEPEVEEETEESEEDEVIEESAPEVSPADNEEEEKVDNMCTLTAEHLEMEKLRVLTAMGGLFYAGRLNAVEPPDVYSITLDGERGNRPHIMSREEILRDAIVEISPKTTEELTSGSRICAYWSQQYRCLYPGSVAEPGTPDPALDAKFVSVEFDDGDSGRIALEDIRLLPPNYPIIEYDPNPLQSLSKRRRRVSACASNISTEEKSKSSAPSTEGTSTSRVEQDLEKENKDANRQEIESHKERKRLKKIKKENRKQKSLLHDDKKKKRKHKCNDENCKHKKHHKKHKKHRKHHHSTSSEEVAESPASTEETLEGSFDDEVLAAEEDDEANSVEQEVQAEGAEPIEEEDATIDEVSSQGVEGDREEMEESQDEYFGLANPEDEVTVDDVSSHKKLKKVRDRQESCDSRSKITPFLPPHLMWSWVGKEYKNVKGKGRHRKAFYRQIAREGETISVGDAAVFKSTGNPERPYIGRIETMWECSNSMVVRVKWFYHPEETADKALKLKFPGALFESPHIDENDVQTISHKCNVVPFSEYWMEFGDNLKNYEYVYENNDMYYLAGHYDPYTEVLRMERGVPQLKS